MAELLGSISEKRVFAAVCALVAFLALLFYGFSLKNGFAYDDEGQIVNNQYIKSLEYLPEAFTSCIWRAYYPDCRNFTRYYRPFHTLSYIFTYAISPSAAFFHLVSIVYYIALGAMVFLFLRELTKDRLLSAVLSLVFIAHPVHSEAVMWISSVPELLFGIFALVAFYLHMRGVRYAEWLAPLFYFFALLSKETAIFLPLIIFLYDKLFKNASFDRRYFMAQWRYTLFAGAYFLMRFWVVGLFPAHQRPEELEIIPIAAGFFYSFGVYLQEIVFPMPLLPHMPFLAERGFADISVLSGLAAFILFCGALFLAHKRGLKTLVFGMLFYLIFIFPALVFSAVNLVVAERYLLLPSLGIILAVGYWLGGAVAKRAKSPWVEAACLAALVVFLVISAAAVIPQNKIWASSKTLYEHIHAINKSRGFLTDQTYFNLALIYEGEGDTEKAKAIYEEIIDDPGSSARNKSEAYNNLGTVYFEKGEYEAAMPYFRKAIAHNPKNIFALLNLAQASYKLRAHGEAVQYAIQAIVQQVEYENAWQFLHAMYRDISALPEREIEKTMTSIFKNELWQKWEFSKVERQLSARKGVPERDYISSEFEKVASGRFVRIDFPVDARIEDALSAKMIFVSTGGVLRTIPEGSRRIESRDGKSVLSLYLLPDSLPSEVFFILNDFRYYKFEIE